jgi:hypothetical protein
MRNDRDLLLRLAANRRRRISPDGRPEFELTREHVERSTQTAMRLAPASKSHLFERSKTASPAAPNAVTRRRATRLCSAVSSRSPSREASTTIRSLTEEEIRRSGEEALGHAQGGGDLRRSAASHVHLVRYIHRRWFETTFPVEAGHERTVMVVNRKGTAEPVPSIVPSVVTACENWNYRRQYAPADEGELVELLVAEANTLAVRIYDVHPFLDGNNRTT